MLNMDVNGIIPIVNEETFVVGERDSDRIVHRASSFLMGGNSRHEVSCNRNIPSALKANLPFEKDCNGNIISVEIDAKPVSDRLCLNSSQPETDDTPEDQEKLLTKNEKIEVLNFANPTPNTKGCREENQLTSSQPLEAASTTDIEDTSEAQIKCPWYDVHLAMQRRSSYHGKEVDVDDMMDKYTYADLRSKIVTVQQQLIVYYDLMNKYEESKAREAKLEKEVTKYKTALKKLAIQRKKAKKELGEREREIVQLKIDLAHSKGLQEHQESEVRRTSAGRNLLLKEKKTSS
uniref:Uncharacterized protein n=1 Tax=Helicotheca tamesis TaxID=374047 RepID=A0A6U0HG38_9STRA|mmetsp:Transcript_6335/g.8549  ORF Transcript_6335/g.8549 Transcript_6335/m.8549 type:complete len:291 (+) Transcript_6335:197-1069(+)